MLTRHLYISLLFLLLSSCTYAQKKFKVEVKETGTWKEIYRLVDEEGNLIRQLDSSLYYTSFHNDQYQHFVIFGKKGRAGWTAIDAEENELFTVYNTSFGEPTPDYLVENKIRIVDKNEKIGFANHKGEIIIQPQFEIATSFHNGKAIIGQACKKIPWDNHEKESGCKHYSVTCMRHGYIDENGRIIKIGDHSFQNIMAEIGWEPPED